QEFPTLPSRGRSGTRRFGTRRSGPGPEPFAGSNPHGGTRPQREPLKPLFRRALRIQRIARHSRAKAGPYRGPGRAAGLALRLGLEARQEFSADVQPRVALKYLRAEIRG